MKKTGHKEKSAEEKKEIFKPHCCIPCKLPVLMQSR